MADRTAGGEHACLPTHPEQLAELPTCALFCALQFDKTRSTTEQLEQYLLQAAQQAQQAEAEALARADEGEAGPTPSLAHRFSCTHLVWHKLNRLVDHAQCSRRIHGVHP